METRCCAGTWRSGLKEDAPAADRNFLAIKDAATIPSYLQ
jgi:hypothetical protein